MRKEKSWFKEHTGTIAVVASAGGLALTTIGVAVADNIYGMQKVNEVVIGGVIGLTTLSVLGILFYAGLVIGREKIATRIAQRRIQRKGKQN